MPILKMRAAIVDALREALPELSIEEHPRRSFTMADVHDALKDRTLALRVAFAGVPEDTARVAHDVHTPMAWAVYVAAKDHRDCSRDRAILTILPEVIRVATYGDFCTTFDIEKTEKVRAAPLDEGEQDTSVKSASIWAVTWLQVGAFPPAPSDDIRPFLTLITRYDLVEQDGEHEATDHISMESAE